MKQESNRGACVAQSDLPRLEINPRIDPCVGQIGQKVHDQAEQREDVQAGEDDRVVSIDDALERKKPEAVKAEDVFNQQRSCEERVDERAGKPAMTISIALRNT